MPRLSHAASSSKAVEFVASVPLDLMNAMYFTHLAGEMEGIDGQPLEVRKTMDRKLRAELDFLYTFPKEQPGLMGSFGDGLFGRRETWGEVESLLRFLRGLPPGLGTPESPGVQGLAFYSMFTSSELFDRRDIPAGEDAEAVLREVLSGEGLDVEGILAVYNRPEELRERMARLIEEFYEKHYRHDLPRRMTCLQRSIAAHQGAQAADVVELARKLTGRAATCLEDVCAGPFERYVFVPSLDMGPYISCAVAGKVHGLFYPCEQEFVERKPAKDERLQRAARIHKALSDEQRLGILGLLRDGEMYAQEIVERTGLNQSVVSRHLTFMRAVGLVTARRQNNMKFFSINPSIREELATTFELLMPEPREPVRRSGPGGG